jgi:hypothetical protein
LLPQSIADVDGIAESRRGTVSVFDGPPPEMKIVKDARQEEGAVAAWIADRLGDGYLPQEIGVFVRSDAQMDRARKAVAAAKADHAVLGEDVQAIPARS